MTGWPIATIGGACTVFSGGTPSKANADYWRGPIPWVSAKDLKADRIFGSELHISHQACEESAAKMAPVGSLLMLVRGMGLANGIQVGEVTSPVAFNQDLRAIVPPPTVDSRFLLLALRYRLADGGKGVLSSAAHGTLKIDADALRRIEFPVPPLDEQRRIVAILDEAFEGIATAKVNAEKNLQSARELFDGYLRDVFRDFQAGWLQSTVGEHIRFIDYRGKTPQKTSHGLRLITAKNVKKGFIQKEPMEFVAPGSYEGWMTRGIPRHGDVLFTTEAPLGNVAQLDTAERVVFAQRIIVMQPNPAVLDSGFLKYMLLSGTMQDKLRAQATGATAQGIKASLLKRIPISFPSTVGEQAAIVDRLDALAEEISRLEGLYGAKLTALDELKKSLLHRAFTGQLSSGRGVPTRAALPPQMSSPQFTAAIISLAYERHRRRQREKTFGHVKQQKLLHLVEALARVDLGRQPIKDAAGPNDFPHQLKAENWARQNGFYDVIQRDGGGYDFKRLSGFDKLLDEAPQVLGASLGAIESVIDLLIPMDTQEAELFATVHAAWNNLLIDGAELTDAAIVREARDTWHTDKLKIPEAKFLQAIALIRSKGLAPDGSGKYVGGQIQLI